VAHDYSVNPDTGLIEPARQCLSPNRDARPANGLPDTVILHGISLPPGEYGGSEIEALFRNELDWDAHPYFGEIRGMKVSTHLLIRRDGERQYAALPRVLKAVAAVYPDITAREIAGHCDVAPGRKSDPGPAFDWLRLYDALGETLENKESCT
jgi:AmpD protein